MKSVMIATAGGISNVAVVLALYLHAGYPTLDSVVGVGSLTITGFTLGFVAILVSAHTRLVTPAVGFLTVLVATVYLELATPMPDWNELDGHVIVDGPTYVASYANTWYVWLSLVLFAGVIEFGIRDGYGIAARRLRNLPALPLSRYVITWVVVGFASVLGIATMLLVIRSGIRPGLAALAVFVVATAVGAVPLAALLTRGMVAPTILFVLVVPYFLTIEVFTTTDSPVHILLFGPYVIVLAIVWYIEATIRSRLYDWDGGKFKRQTTT